MDSGSVPLTRLVRDDVRGNQITAPAAARPAMRPEKVQPPKEGAFLRPVAIHAAAEAGGIEPRLASIVRPTRRQVRHQRAR